MNYILETEKFFQLHERWINFSTIMSESFLLVLKLFHFVDNTFDVRNCSRLPSLGFISLKTVITIILQRETCVLMNNLFCGRKDKWKQ